jgi:hypothetical protein
MTIGLFCPSSFRGAGRRPASRNGQYRALEPDGVSRLARGEHLDMRVAEEP